jgi:hypothetical protein
VLHAISFLPVTLLGVVFMMREGLTLAGARRMAEEAAGEAREAHPASAIPLPRGVENRTP